MRKISDGAKVFIKNDKLNKYILILRDDKDSIPYPNLWEFVGGRIEENESPIETIEREVEEELNIDIYDLEHLSTEDVVHTLKNRTFNITGHYYKAKTDVTDLSNIKLTEGQAVEYYSREQMLTMENIVPTIKMLLRKFPEKLN